MKTNHPVLSGCNRREFLRRTLEVGTALAFSSSFVQLLQGERRTFPSFPDLAVVSGDPVQATKESINLLGGMSRFVKRGDQVVLKPNMSFPNPPSMATTTHPEIVTIVALLCLEAGAKKVMVLDHTLRPPDICLERSGIEAACKGLDDVFVFGLNEEKFFEEFALPQGKELHQVKVVKGVMESDVIINLPVAKSHSNTTVSLGIKNLMGLIWKRWVFHFPLNINEALADLSTLIKPSLILIDATRALTDGGPSGPGKVENLNTVVAGTDPVAVDAYAVTLTKWYGKDFSPHQIKHIAAASQRGLGEINLEKLNIIQKKV